MITNSSKVHEFRAANHPACSGIPAKKTLTLGSFWYGDILFEYCPVCLEFFFFWGGGGLHVLLLLFP